MRPCTTGGLSSIFLARISEIFFPGTAVIGEVGNFDADNGQDITDFSNYFLPNFIATGGGTYNVGQADDHFAKAAQNSVELAHALEAPISQHRATQVTFVGES